MLFSSADLFQNLFFSKNFFQEYYQCVKQFGSRPGRPISGLIWIQTICKGCQQATLAGKELMSFVLCFLNFTDHQLKRNIKKLQFFNTGPSDNPKGGEKFYAMFKPFVLMIR